MLTQEDEGGHCVLASLRLAATPACTALRTSFTPLLSSKLIIEPFVSSPGAQLLLGRYAELHLKAVPYRVPLYHFSDADPSKRDTTSCMKERYGAARVRLRADSSAVSPKAR